jgi:surface antigen
MTIRKAALCAALALSLGACQGQTTGETVGSLGGAAGGALLGSQFGSGGGQLAATAIGTLAGALAGRQLGRYVEGNDQQYAANAEEQAVSQNQSITWNNSDTGRRGVVEPVRTYENQNGQTCREYTHTVYIGGRAESARGTACRDADGTWRLVS